MKNELIYFKTLILSKFSKKSPLDQPFSVDSDIISLTSCDKGKLRSFMKQAWNFEVFQDIKNFENKIHKICIHLDADCSQPWWISPTAEIKFFTNFLSKLAIEIIRRTFIVFSYSKISLRITKILLVLGRMGGLVKLLSIVRSWKKNPK